ncbi:hypothetical protein JQM66_12435, partial [Oscillibacter valericigenes]|nr:hypothetical protein [Oscillibacter valericigenes]
VAKQAIGLGLNKGLLVDFDGGKQITREEAALFAFNTLQATLVEYDEKTTINVGGAQVVLQGKAQDVAWGTAKLNDGNIKPDGFVQFAEKHFPKLVKKPTSDAFGRPAYIWANNKKDLGTYVDYSKMVGEYTVATEGKEVYTDAGTIVLDGKYTLNVWVDGVESDIITKADLKKSNDSDLEGTGNGVLTQVFVDNDDEIVTITEINTYLAKTDDYNEKKETLALDDVYGYDPAVAVIKLEDIPAIEKYEDGDMVLVTIADGVVQTIVDPETIDEATLTEFSKGKSVTTGGTKYEYAETAVYEAGTLNNYDNDNLDNVTYDMWLDQYGYLIGIKIVTEKTKYLFVTGYDMGSSNLTNKTAEASVIFADDGTMDTIKVNVGKSTFAAGEQWVWNTGDITDAGVNKWYTYSEKDGVYTLKSVAAQFQGTKADNSVIDKAHVAIKDTTPQTAEWRYANDGTKFITVKTSDLTHGNAHSATANTGCLGVIGKVVSFAEGVKNVNINVFDTTDVQKDLKFIDKNGNAVAPHGTTNTVSSGIYALYNAKTNYIIAAVVVGEDAGAASSIAYLYGEPENEKFSDGKYYWDMKAVIGGKATPVTFKSELPYDDAFTAGLYQLFKDAADEYIIDADPWNGDTFAQYNTNPTTTKAIEATYANAVDLSATKNTLWITSKTAKQGVALDNDCPAVVIENKAGKLKTVEYATVEKAIKNLSRYDETNNFKGTIYVFTEGGVATSVILVDDIYVAPTYTYGGVEEKAIISDLNASALTGEIEVVRHNGGTSALDLIKATLKDAGYTFNYTIPNTTSETGYDVVATMGDRQTKFTVTQDDVAYLVKLELTPACKAVAKLSADYLWVCTAEWSEVTIALNSGVTFPATRNASVAESEFAGSTGTASAGDTSMTVQISFARGQAAADKTATISWS